MKMKHILAVMGMGVGCFSIHASSAWAASSDWNIQTDTQAIYGNYSGSVKRKSVAGAGVIVRADYLDTGGFSLGGNYTKLSFANGSALNQQAFYASVRYNTYWDALPGPLTLKLDGHLINNNDATANTDNVQVIAPQLSFLNYAKTFYLDLGYAHSTYQNNLSVQQWTPTLGLGWNAGADWLQMRGYFITPSNQARAQNKTQTTALDVKWTHWLAPDAWLGLEKVQVSGLAGERIYAVDGDAAAVYNLADIQKGSIAVAAQWRIAQHHQLMLSFGNERYLDNTINNTYDNRYAYMDVTSQW